MNPDQRLKNVVDNLKMHLVARQAEIAWFIDIGETYLSDLANGKKKITDAFLLKANQNAKINPKYISGESKEMYVIAINDLIELFRTFKKSEKYRRYLENNPVGIVGKFNKSDDEPDYKDKYIKLLEKREEENELSLKHVLAIVAGNQKLLGALYDLVEDSKKDKTLIAIYRKEIETGK